MGYRIVVTTATRRQVAAGGRFATAEEAEEWAEGMRRYDAVPGEVVDGVPSDTEAASKYDAAALIRADHRDAVASQPLAVDEPDELLDIDQVAAHWGISRESVEQGVARGFKPEPDAGSGRTGKWRRITVAQWDREAAARRSRS